VNVDLSGILAVGDQFVIVDAQNFFSGPLVSGKYNGGTVSIPMTNLKKAVPEGFTTPAHTAPLLGTFIVLPASSSSTRPAPPQDIGITVR
jgi:hypothetical protein